MRTQYIDEISVDPQGGFGCQLGLKEPDIRHHLSYRLLAGNVPSRAPCGPTTVDELAVFSDVAQTVILRKPLGDEECTRKR